MHNECNEHDMRRAMKLAMRAGRRWGAGFAPGGPFPPFGPDFPFGPDGPFGPGNPFGGDGPRGRGRRRMFAGGELRLVLLKLVADQPRHGYDLIKAIEGLTGGAYAPSPGVVYPTLQMMLDEGMISELPDDSARKVLSITDAGKEELAREAEAVEGLIERLTGVGEERHSSPHRQIHRAMENVRNALRQQRRALRESGDELAEKIVDVLDEAARRIDRL